MHPATSQISAADLGCPWLSRATGCSQVPVPLIKGFAAKGRRRLLFSHPVPRNAEYEPFGQDAECPVSSSLANKQLPLAMRPKVNELSGGGEGLVVPTVPTQGPPSCIQRPLRCPWRHLSHRKASHLSLLKVKGFAGSSQGCGWDLVDVHHA